MELNIAYKSFCVQMLRDSLSDNRTFFVERRLLRRNCVQHSSGTDAFQSLCGYFERTFSKYPKKLNILQYIGISFEAQKRNFFNYLSKRSRVLRVIQEFRALE